MCVGRLSGRVCGTGPPRFENVRWRLLVKSLGPGFLGAGWLGGGGAITSVGFGFSCGFWAGEASDGVVSRAGGESDGTGCGDSLSELRGWDWSRAWADVPSPGSKGVSGFATLVLLPCRVVRCVGSGIRVRGPGLRPGGGGDGGISFSRSSKFSPGSAFSA